MDENGRPGWLEKGKMAVEAAALAGQLASPFVGPMPNQADLADTRGDQSHHLPLPDYGQQGMDWLGLQAERENEKLREQFEHPGGFDPGASGPPV